MALAQAAEHRAGVMRPPARPPAHPAGRPTDRPPTDRPTDRPATMGMLNRPRHHESPPLPFSPLVSPARPPIRPPTHQPPTPRLELTHTAPSRNKPWLLPARRPCTSASMQQYPLMADAEGSWQRATWADPLPWRLSCLGSFLFVRRSVPRIVPDQNHKPTGNSFKSSGTLIEASVCVSHLLYRAFSRSLRNSA